MFIAFGSSKVEWNRDDPIYLEHRDYVTDLVNRGVLLCTGPRVGGGSVIIGYGSDREKFSRLIAEDPFSVAGYVSFDIHEFTPGLVDPRLGIDIRTEG